MEKYIGLLTEASNKSDYRKRPVDTLKQVQKLANESAKRREDDLAKEKIRYNLSTPARVAISDAVRKSGAKAFKEMTKAPNKALNDLLYKKRRLELEDAPPSAIEMINDEIDALLGKQKKQEDLEKSLEKYRDRPEIYLAKLQEVKQEKEEQLQKELLEKLEQQQKLFKSTLTAEQLLKADDSFSALPKSEQKLLLDYLKKSTKGDTFGRKEFVKQFVSGDTTKKRELMRSILQNEPIKTKEQIKDVSQDVLVKQMRSDALSRFRFKSSKQKQYVKEKLNMDNLAVDSQSINNAIQQYMDEYTETEPKKTDIVFEEASKKQKRKERKRQAMEQAEETSAELEAENELASKTGNPFAVLAEEEPVRDSLANQFLSEGSTKDEAMQDAGEAIHKTREELARQLELAQNTPLPESEEEEAPDDKQLIDEAVSWALTNRRAQINKNFGNEETFKQAVELDRDIADEVKMDYIKNKESTDIPQYEIPFGEEVINTMQKEKLLKFYNDNSIPLPPGKDGNPPNLTTLRKNLIRIRTSIIKTKFLYAPRKGKGKGLPVSGKGFKKGRGMKPITAYPHDLVAGSLAKHINTVRNNRFKQNINKMSVNRNTENEEYRKGLKQHLLRGGSFLSFLF